MKTITGWHQAMLEASWDKVDSPASIVSTNETTKITWDGEYRSLRIVVGSAKEETVTLKDNPTFKQQVEQLIPANIAQGEWRVE